MEIKVLASGSSGNCYIIDDGETKLLIEAGIQVKSIQKALNFDLQSIAGCLISHQHLDHCKAVSGLLRLTVDCYLSLATADALGVAGHHRAKIIKPMQRFTVGSFAILPFDTPHDVDNLGFLIASKKGEKCIFLADTPYCRYKFSGLTMVVVEANYSIDLLKANKDLSTEVKKRVVRNHMSIETVKGFLKANDLRKVDSIHLIHLSSANSDEARFKREVQGLTGIPTYTY